MEEVHGSDWRDHVTLGVPRASSREPVTEPGPDGDRPQRAAEEREDGRSVAGSSEVSPPSELLARLEQP